MKTIYLSSAYLAPVEYYAKLVAYDKIFIEQHDHYVKQTYRNRCTIAAPDGELALSIPTVKPDTLKWEKLQKEKEEYSKQLDLDYVDKNYIPIQKVKDEKEKLDKKYNELVDKVYKDPLKALTDFQRVVGGQAILNALLKEGET